MRIIKKSGYLLSVFSLLQLLFFVSCYDDCGGTTANRFKTTGISLSNLKLENSQAGAAHYTFTSAGPEEELKAEQYAIGITPLLQTYTAQRQAAPPLTNYAFACSPLPPYSEESILSLSIRSKQAFGEGFPAGSDISSFFDIVIADPDHAHYMQRMSLQEFLSDSPTVKTQYYLLLNSPIKQSGFYQFVLSFEKTLHGNKEKFETETTAVKLTAGQ